MMTEIITNFQKKLTIIMFLDKRQRFLIQSLILTAGILVIQQYFNEYKFILAVFISFLTYILTTWSLKEDIKKYEWILLFILPVLLTLSVSLFYFLLPNRVVYKSIVTVFFAISSYAVLLIENIFNVAVVRSIQLTRAAQSVGMLISLIIIFLFSNIIYSFRWPFYSIFLITTIIGFLLSLQSLWSVDLEENISEELLQMTMITALGIGELGAVLSFWPVQIATYSLLITSAYYMLVSVFQLKLSGRLFRNSIKEFIYVFIFTLILTIFTTSWS
jgi:hypothetical protein